jgi:hypothetical protein
LASISLVVVVPFMPLFVLAMPKGSDD